MEESECVEEQFFKETVSENNVTRNSKEKSGPEDEQPEDFVEIDMEAAEEPVKKPSNSYAAKKTVAQGMMDIALITANANQLRYIITFNRNSSTFYVNLFLIIISLLLQVGVGLSLIFKGRYDMKGESKSENAKRINNYVVVGVFLVTIINVFVASFTTTESANTSAANMRSAHGENNSPTHDAYYAKPI